MSFKIDHLSIKACWLVLSCAIAKQVDKSFVIFLWVQGSPSARRHGKIKNLDMFISQVEMQVVLYTLQEI